MLKSIIVVTIAVLNLEPVETAYQQEFNYKTIERQVVSQDMAEVWSASDMEGRPYVLMQADSDKPVYIRFVEQPAVKGYSPLTTTGWNATELLVLDPDAMAEQLEGSAFEMIGEPKDLWAAPNAPRAMQVVGPGQEVTYLTRNGQFATTAKVDRLFIMVLGGPSMSAFADFYGTQLGLDVGDATPFKISVISKAQGLPADTAYPLAVATVSKDYLIELDQYPEHIPARPYVAGEIPPGIALVGFAVDNLDELDVSFRAEPQALKRQPYNGSRVAVSVGPAGEWLELIEQQVASD